MIAHAIAAIDSTCVDIQRVGTEALHVVNASKHGALAGINATLESHFAASLDLAECFETIAGAVASQESRVADTQRILRFRRGLSWGAQRRHGYEFAVDTNDLCCLAPIYRDRGRY